MNSRETYLDDAESREWLIDVHCSCLSDEQKALIRRCCSAFVLYGNEDCPDGIDIYSTNSPMNGEAPMLRLRQDLDGNLEP